jgi:hypothetical protein
LPRGSYDKSPFGVYGEVVTIVEVKKRHHLKPRHALVFALFLSREKGHNSVVTRKVTKAVVGVEAPQVVSEEFVVAQVAVPEDEAVHS